MTMTLTFDEREELDWMRSRAVNEWGGATRPHVYDDLGRIAGRCHRHGEGQHHEMCPEHPDWIAWRAADASRRAAAK